MRPSCVLFGAALAMCVLALRVDAHDGAKTRTPLIGGRAIPELVLMVPIHLGRQFPGMLIMPEMTILPNRFVPVREDQEGVYYQAVARFMREDVSGRTSTGGLYLDKKHPEKIWAYVGDGREADFKVGSSAYVGLRHQDVKPNLALPLPPDCVRKLKIAQPVR